MPLSAVLAAACTAAGCVPVPPPARAVAQLDHIVMLLEFDCARDGPVRAHVTGTRIVLSTPRGSEVYTGAYPTYFGHEASVSFAGEYGSFVRAADGADQVCLLTGMG